MQSVTPGTVQLEVRPGEVVSVVWIGTAPIQELVLLDKQQVVVEGAGEFDPSGRLSCLLADCVQLGDQRHEFFRRVPVIPVNRDYASLVRLRPGEQSVYEFLLGCLPAEESDEEFIAAIEELS